MVTVIMPVYNSELYIRGAIESILSQTYRDYEFLIIDDASTDQTISIIKSYKDLRIHLIEKPQNTGYTRSLNLGLKKAKGKYIARMDSDDISLPERFERQISFFEANPDHILCGTSYSVMDQDKKIILPETNEKIRLNLLNSNCIAHPSVMLKREILDKYSLQYNPKMEPTEDYDLWVRLLPKGKFHNLQEVLLNYRMHNSSVSRKRIKEQEISAIKVKLKLLQKVDTPFTQSELNLLKRIFRKYETLDLKDIESFKELQSKLATSNTSNFFEPVGFSNYLADLEKIVINKFIYRYKRYNLLFFWNYLKAKKIVDTKITKFQEAQLFLKSLIFYKIPI